MGTRWFFGLVEGILIRLRLLRFDLLGKVVIDQIVALLIINWRRNACATTSSETRTRSTPSLNGGLAITHVGHGSL